MFKVLVVDDEVYIRKGITNAIQWDYLGLELIGEAEDGFETIKLVDDLNPDLVITDMRMPGMDGISLIHALKSKHSQIKIIVISAYSDFEYTRQAIINKAFDYILKPVKKDDLNSVLSKCVNEMNKDSVDREYRARLGNESSDLESIVKKYIFDVTADELDIEESNNTIHKQLYFPNVYCCVCKIDNINYVENTDVIDRLELVKNDIEACTKEIVDRQVVFINRSDNEIVYVFCMKSCENKSILKLLECTTKYIYNQRNFTISIGLGAVAKTPCDLYNSHKQAMRAVEMKKLSSTSIVVNYLGIDSDKTLELTYSNYNRNLFLSTLKTGDFEKSYELFKKLLGEFLSEGITVYTFHKYMIILFGDIEKELSSFNTSIDNECGKNSMAYVDEIIGAFSIDEMEDIFHPVINTLSLFFKMKKRKGGKKIIDDIIKSMNNDYFSQISVYGYANQYHLNPDYLGRIFKNQTGKSFVDYLTNIRINKAKELIENDLCNHYYDVATNVGYEEYSYFCKVFKMATGFAPGEYRVNCSNSRM